MYKKDNYVTVLRQTPYSLCSICLVSIHVYPGKQVWGSPVAIKVARLIRGLSLACIASRVTKPPGSATIKDHNPTPTGRAERHEHETTTTLRTAISFHFPKRGDHNARKNRNNITKRLCCHRHYKTISNKNTSPDLVVPPLQYYLQNQSMHSTESF